MTEYLLHTLRNKTSSSLLNMPEVSCIRRKRKYSPSTQEIAEEVGLLLKQRREAVRRLLAPASFSSPACPPPPPPPRPLSDAQHHTLLSLGSGNLNTPAAPCIETPSLPIPLQTSSSSSSSSSPSAPCSPEDTPIIDSTNHSSLPVIRLVSAVASKPKEERSIGSPAKGFIYSAAFGGLSGEVGEVEEGSGVVASQSGSESGGDGGGETTQRRTPQRFPWRINEAHQLHYACTTEALFEGTTQHSPQITIGGTEHTAVLAVYTPVEATMLRFTLHPESSGRRGYVLQNIGKVVLGEEGGEEPITACLAVPNSEVMVFAKGAMLLAVSAGRLDCVLWRFPLEGKGVEKMLWVPWGLDRAQLFCMTKDSVIKVELSTIPGGIDAEVSPIISTFLVEEGAVDISVVSMHRPSLAVLSGCDAQTVLLFDYSMPNSVAYLKVPWDGPQIARFTSLSCCGVRFAVEVKGSSAICIAELCNGGCSVGPHWHHITGEREVKDVADVVPKDCLHTWGLTPDDRYVVSGIGSALQVRSPEQGSLTAEIPIGRDGLKVKGVAVHPSLVWKKGELF